MESKIGIDYVLLNQFGRQAVKGFTIEPLINEGQYFTSYVEKVTVFLETNNEKSKIDLIIKILPSQESDIELNSKLKFKKERNFYQLALPEYHKIQANNNLPKQNLFPEFYTATEEMIVLKDLGSEGYCVCNNFLNEVQSKLVLQELAKFHATGIALKQSNHKIFEEQLASVVNPALRNASNPARDEINVKFRTEINQLIRSNDKLKVFAEAVDSLLSKIDNTKLPTPCEPFSTLLHNDLWRGNILCKYSPITGELADVKFIDFQTMIFNSPARDIIYFLFSSVEEEVLRNFSDILMFYHLCFVNYLSDLGINSSEFSFEGLMFEVNSYGPTKLKHILLLFKALSCNDSRKVNFEKYLERVLILFRDRGWI